MFTLVCLTLWDGICCVGSGLVSCQSLFLCQLIIVQSQRKRTGDFRQVLVDTARMLAESIRSVTNYDVSITLLVAVIGCAASCEY